MKKLLSIFIVISLLLSCDKRNDPDVNYSGISAFLGEWTLQSRILNEATPLPIGTEQLNITDDNSLANYKGNYELINTGSENGNFALDNKFATITFTSSNNVHTTYRFYILERTLQLFLDEENGDIITENWTKVIE